MGITFSLFPSLHGWSAHPVYAAPHVYGAPVYGGPGYMMNSPHSIMGSRRNSAHFASNTPRSRNNVPAAAVSAANIPAAEVLAAPSNSGFGFGTSNSGVGNMGFGTSNSGFGNMGFGASNSGFGNSGFNSGSSDGGKRMTRKSKTSKQRTRKNNRKSQ